MGGRTARRGCGRGGGGARLRHSAAAAETEGRQWRRRQVAEEGRWSSEVAAAARGVGVGVWVCVPPWPSAQCAPAAPPLGMASERRQVLWYACYGLCSSQQVKPGSGWQEQQGAAAAEVAAGRGCGTARLRQRPKAGSGVGGKWQKKVGGAASVAAAAHGVGVGGVGVCATVALCAVCARGAAPWTWPPSVARYCGMLCYGLCSSQQVKPGSGWQEQQGAAAAEVAAGRGCGTARLRQRPKAGSGVGGKWRKKVGGAASVAAAARGVGVGVWVCVPPWPSAQCAPAAPPLGHGLRASPGTVVCMLWAV